MESVFDWSKDLGQFINYNIEDDFITKMESNSDKRNSLSIIITGQLRGFFNIIDKFNNLIEELKLIFPKVVIFFYVSTEVSYTYRFNNDIDKLNYLKNKYNNSIDDFKKVITGINCESIIKIKDKNIYNNPHLYQLYDIYQCHLDVYDYERDNNMKFNHILKMRPDIYLNNINLNLNNIFSKNILYFNWDFVYTYPRDFSILFDQYISEFSKDTNFFVKILSNYKNKLPPGLNTINTEMLLGHFMFIISTQYLKIIKYEEFHGFMIEDFS